MRYERRDHLHVLSRTLKLTRDRIQPWPCPGDNDIQCCIATAAAPHPPENAGNVGAKVLAKAREAKGTPHTLGGGSCNGPTRGGDGEVGFDCSGLVCWALC